MRAFAGVLPRRKPGARALAGLHSGFDGGFAGNARVAEAKVTIS